MGLTAGFLIDEVATVPLVQRTGIDNKSVIGSADFVASVETPDSGVKRLIVIEVKGRVKPNTAQQQRLQNGLAKLRLSTSTGLDDSKKKYFAIRAEDDVFPYFVEREKEALQILHNAYLYDAEWTLLLIGDDFARVIAGIFVKFDATLKQAWGKVLNDMYRLSIYFLYERPREPFELKEEQHEILTRVLPTIKAAGASIDMHSFEQFIKIWRMIRLVWPKPLPPLTKMIPLLYSVWNSMKGGSDTITKMIWSANYSPPCHTPQANGIARMFLLLFIQCHRANQVATSKQSMPYKSLLHFRNANNKRFSLHESLLAISHSLGENETTESTKAETISDDDSPPPSPKIQGRATRGTKPSLQV